MVFIFLAYFTLYNGLQFHPSQQNWFKRILFNGWVIFHGVYVPQLPYLFICWWTYRLLPCPGYYKQRCDEHWGTRVSFSPGFLGVYAQEWDCWVIWKFYFQFFKESLCGLFLKSVLNLLQKTSIILVFWHQGTWDLAPQPGIKPTPPALEGEVLTTGLPGGGGKKEYATKIYVVCKI